MEPFNKWQHSFILTTLLYRAMPISNFQKTLQVSVASYTNDIPEKSSSDSSLIPKRQFDSVIVKKTCSRVISSMNRARITGEHFTFDQTVRSPNELLGFNDPTSNTHTMGKSIEKFSTQKLPMGEIKKALENGNKIDVLEVDSLILLCNKQRFGFKSLEKIDFNHNATPKEYNYGRPVFFEGTTHVGEKKIVAAVVPGHDYFKHYVSLIRHAVSTVLGYDSENLIKTISLNKLSGSLVDYKGLDKRFVKPGDTVIIGHVRDMEKRLLGKKLSLEKISEFKSDHYGSTRYKLNNGTIINFLGSKDSFWGGMAGDLATRVLELNASKLIYVAKLGAMTQPQDIYNRIFSPSKFVRLNHTQVVGTVINNVENPVARQFPSLNSGLHASIPTIPEEDLDQREKLTELGASSIDNEISCIADNISKFNQDNNRSVPFIPLHFATDYLRKKDEIGLEIAHDLSSNRTKDAKSKKATVLDQLSEVLANHLQEVDNKKVTVTIAGTGYGAKTIIPGLENTPVKIIDILGGRDIDKTRRLSSALGIDDPSNNFLEAMEKQSELTFIATPHARHEEMLKLALSKPFPGHIVCEKPLALTAGGVDQILELSRAKPGLRLVNHPLRFHPLIFRMQNLIRDGKIGALKEIEIMDRRNLFGVKDENDWFKNTEEGGGMLAAMGSHFLDVASYITNRTPEKLNNANVEKKSDKSDHKFELDVNYGNDIPVRISCDGTVAEENTKIIAKGENGNLEFSLPGELRFTALDGEETHLSPDFKPKKSIWKEAFNNFGAELVESIRNDTTHIFEKRASNFKDFAEYSKIMEAAKR